MDFIDQLKMLSSRIVKQADMIQTEEATKNAFVMPFITLLGYNVFDPTEVTPELDADIGTKKGEKVDYAILQDGKPTILFECKSCKTNLDGLDITQIYRYFTATEASFGIITNGIIYRFYTDLEEKNKMDKKPFFEINLLDIKDSFVDDLKRFCKSTFNLEETLTAAAELKYTREIKKILSEQLTNPSEDFIRFFATQVYSGKFTQNVKQQFTDLTKRAFNHFINDRINERLKSALAEDIPTATPVQVEDDDMQDKTDVKVVTTQEELEAFYAIKSVLSGVIDLKRVVHRDTQSYFGILLDNSNRKPIARLYFNSSRKRIAVLDSEKKEELIDIESIDEIFKYKDKIIASALKFEDSPQA